MFLTMVKAILAVFVGRKYEKDLKGRVNVSVSSKLDF